MIDRNQRSGVSTNSHNFPISISKFLLDYRNHCRNELRPDLKTFYKSRFQKGNRWNKTLIRKGTIHYTAKELNQLLEVFRILFHEEKKYNQTFIACLKILQEERTDEEEGINGPKIKISQKAFTELLHTLGELKRSGEIHNSYRELARIAYRTFSPESKLQTSTISERLKNQKGFK